MSGEFWTTLLAVWGVVFTINSALSALLQTKWMYNQKNTLKEMLRVLKDIKGDDLKKRGGD